MTSRQGAVAALMLLGLLMPVRGAAQDLTTYVQLSAEASSAFEGLDDDASSERRERAVQAADAVIAWLRGFRLASAYASMSPEERAAVVLDLHRWEYNGARQRVALGQCERARDDLAEVLAEGVSDEALLPRVGVTYAEAVACATPAFGVIESVVEPEDAFVFLDGVRLGPVGEPYRVPIGAHVLELRADGYRSVTLDVTIDADGDRLVVGPMALAVMPDVLSEAPRPVPRARPVVWSLAGGLGVAGVGSLVAAETYRARAGDAPAGFELADPGREDGIVQRRRVIGASSLAVGLTTAIVAAVIHGPRYDADVARGGGASRVVQSDAGDVE